MIFFTAAVSTKYYTCYDCMLTLQNLTLVSTIRVRMGDVGWPTVHFSATARRTTTAELAQVRQPFQCLLDYLSAL